MTNTINLKQFECSFRGREVGAIGIFYHINFMVKAENEDQARLKVYDKYEHLSDVKIIELK